MASWHFFAAAPCMFSFLHDEMQKHAWNIRGNINCWLLTGFVLRLLQNSTLFEIIKNVSFDILFLSPILKVLSILLLLAKAFSILNLPMQIIARIMGRGDVPTQKQSRTPYRKINWFLWSPQRTPIQLQGESFLFFLRLVFWWLFADADQVIHSCFFISLCSTLENNYVFDTGCVFH